MRSDLQKSPDALLRTPMALDAMLTGLDDEFVHAMEGPETFSPFDIIGHLIDGEDPNWIPRARIILGRGRVLRFAPFDRFRHRARNASRPLSSLIEEFTRLRAANVDALRSWQLSATELELSGEHPSLGPVTLRQLLADWVVHGLGHIGQAARVIAKQYGGEIGPWMPYLPVASDRLSPASQ